MPDMALATLDGTNGRNGGAQGHNMTCRLVEHVAKAGLVRTFLDVARETGLDQRTVRRIVADHIRQLESGFRFETPTWLGLDEIHILGKVCGVVANVEHHCLVGILPSRDQDRIGRYIRHMPDTDLIDLVAIDMWRPYKAVVNELLPKAGLVIDRFHVVRMANESLDEVRKSVRRELPTKKRLLLKDDRFLLFSRESKLDKRGRTTVARWTEEFPLLGDAWAAKERFLTIWDTARSSRQAGEMVDAWVAALPEALKEPFHPLVRAMGNWRDDILRYFDTPGNS